MFIVPARNGEVTFYVGQLSRKEVQARERQDSDAPKPARPELTQTMQNYLGLHRHASVRADLLKHQGTALRLAVAMLISGAKADPQKAKTDAIADSLAQNPAIERFAQERGKVSELLKLEDSNHPTMIPSKEDWNRSLNVHAIFAALLRLEDAEVLQVLTYAIAEIMPAGSVLVEVLGNLLQVDTAEDWKADETFLDLWRPTDPCATFARGFQTLLGTYNM